MTDSSNLQILQELNSVVEVIYQMMIRKAVNQKQIPPAPFFKGGESFLGGQQLFLTKSSIFNRG